MDEQVERMIAERDHDELLSWIQDQLLRIPTDEGRPVVGEIEDALSAWFE
jgi:hypothetical protein